MSHFSVWEAISGYSKLTTSSKGNRVQVISLSSTLRVTENTTPGAGKASVPLPRPLWFPFRETSGGGSGALSEAFAL